MKELYEALIEGIPAHARVRLACRGRWQAYVETEDGAGVSSLLIPGKQPYSKRGRYVLFRCHTCFVFFRCHTHSLGSPGASSPKSFWYTRNFLA